MPADARSTSPKPIPLAPCQGTLQTKRAREESPQAAIDADTASEHENHLRPNAAKNGAGPSSRRVKHTGVEDDLRALHGPLTQLNLLYRAQAHGADALSASDDEEDRKARAAAQEAARAARRRRLEQLPLPCVSVYAQLAEAGVASADRAAAAIITVRARAAVERGAGPAPSS